MTQNPDNLYEFGFFPRIDDVLKDLAELAEPEDWAYHNTPSEREYPVLFNYIKFTYKKLAEENKIEFSSDAQFACFNTGLVTTSQEPIYASFQVNRGEGRSPWCFGKWLRRGEWELNKFDELPEMAHYFDDPTCLVLDPRKEIRVNIEHIIKDNKERFPEPYRSMDNYGLQTFLKGAVDNAKERVRRSYKAAIPQYYHGHVQLLLPLCLSNPSTADLALVVERHSSFYRGSTCLTLDMAYNNARQISKPEREWLQP